MDMGMDQYLLIPFLGGWTSIYQLFWCSPGVQGFDTLPYVIILKQANLFQVSDFWMNLSGKMWSKTMNTWEWNKKSREFHWGLISRKLNLEDPAKHMILLGFNQAKVNLVGS